MPKISFYSALPVGTASLEEVLDIELMIQEDADVIQEKLNSQLPEEMAVVRAIKVAASEKKPHLKESRFLISAFGIPLEEDFITQFLKSETFPVVKIDKNGEQDVDARPLVSSLSLVADDKIEMSIKATAGRGLRPIEIVKAIFRLKDEDVLRMETVKTGQILE